MLGWKAADAFVVLTGHRASRLTQEHPGPPRFEVAGPLRVSATTDAQFMLFGGSRMGPRYIWWNFVSSRPERIEQAGRQSRCRRQIRDRLSQFCTRREVTAPAVGRFQMKDEPHPRDSARAASRAHVRCSTFSFASVAALDF